MVVTWWIVAFLCIGCHSLTVCTANYARLIRIRSHCDLFVALRYLGRSNVVPCLTFTEEYSVSCILCFVRLTISINVARTAHFC